MHIDELKKLNELVIAVREKRDIIVCNPKWNNVKASTFGFSLFIFYL